jgi:hypothetical protein
LLRFRLMLLCGRADPDADGGGDDDVTGLA